LSFVTTASPWTSRGDRRRGEPTRRYAKEWQQAFKLSADTVEPAIKKAKKGLAKK
jgi:hypothetical protein